MSKFQCPSCEHVCDSGMTYCCACGHNLYSAGATKTARRSSSELGAVSWLDELLALYDDPSAAKWLSSPHKLLNGKTAFQAIRDGESENVARIIEQLTTGAFI